MGNGTSIEAFDPTHVRIYSNIIQIQDSATRAQMIQTCLAGVEYVQVAKRAGIYSYLLGYVSAVQSGNTPPRLPGEVYFSGGGGGGAGASAGAGAGVVAPRSVQGMANPVVYPAATQREYARPQMTLATRKEETQSAYSHITQTPQQKMVSYFSSCLEVLGIAEEVTLTEETLKKAYKKIALRAHPDKGGSEEHFEAITRAYAYLTEILKRIQGGRDRGLQEVTAPSVLSSGRKEESKAWQHVEPVQLNPQKLDMNAFNTMFEQTHMPDPDSDGYGDWLKTEGTGIGGAGGAGGGAGAGGSKAKFKGEFNRDVFNKMFDKEAVRQGASRSTPTDIMHPEAMALTMAPTMGLVLGRDRPDTYTAAPNSKHQYTDLQDAYVREATVSDKVSNVRVEERSFDTYRASREKGPAPMTHTEQARLHEAERQLQEREEGRQRRAAMQATAEQDYFERMKRLVITNH